MLSHESHHRLHVPKIVFGVFIPAFRQDLQDPLARFVSTRACLYFILESELFRIGHAQPAFKLVRFQIYNTAEFLYHLIDVQLRGFTNRCLLSGRLCGGCFLCRCGSFCRRLFCSRLCRGRPLLRGGLFRRLLGCRRGCFRFCLLRGYRLLFRCCGFRLRSRFFSGLCRFRCRLLGLGGLLRRFASCRFFCGSGTAVRGAAGLSPWLLFGLRGLPDCFLLRYLCHPCLQ